MNIEIGAAIIAIYIVVTEIADRHFKNHLKRSKQKDGRKLNGNT